LWNDRNAAQKILQERTRLENSITSYRQLEQRLTDAIELIEMGEAEGDAGIVTEAEQTLGEVAVTVKKLEIECLFSGEADSNDCFLEIHAGAGGTESHDWALMLMRMYLRWAEKHKFKTEIIDELDGEEVGIKSATFRITGHNAYGWCKTESGVHRLVRISPFNSAGKRMTSFASVWVYPVIDDNIEIEINEKDLRIDTYRASGAGGQHINKTDSAVRITHLPTNIVVQCQSDRSQHRNRAEAYAMLRARLYEMELKKREAETDAINASKGDNGWGHQIRSYVLQPYQMVKDLRTSHETSDTSGVLDGDLDDFMSASLAAGVNGKTTKGSDDVE
jgi:peptide chain release factor 2